MITSKGSVRCLSGRTCLFAIGWQYITVSFGEKVYVTLLKLRILLIYEALYWYKYKSLILQKHRL